MKLEIKGHASAHLHAGKSKNGDIDITTEKLKGNIKCNVRIHEYRDLIDNSIKSSNIYINLHGGYNDVDIDKTPFRDDTKICIKKYSNIIQSGIRHRIFNVPDTRISAAYGCMVSANKSDNVDICMNKSVTSVNTTRPIILLFTKDGVDFYGTDMKNIIFGMNGDSIVYSRKFVTDEYLEDDGYDDGGYNADMYYINNIHKLKDGSMVKTQISVCNDMGYTGIDSELLELPKALSCFNDVYYTGLMKLGINNNIKVLHEHNKTNVRRDFDFYGDIYNKFHMFENEKTILSYSSSKWSGGLVLYKYFDNSTEEGAWRDSLLRNVPNIEPMTEKYITYCEKDIKYSDINVFDMDRIVTVVKSGVNMIVSEYETSNERSYRGYRFTKNTLDFVNSTNENMKPLVPNGFQKTNKYVLDTKNNIITIENVESVCIYGSVKVGESEAFVRTHEYIKVAIGGKLQYALVGLCDNTGEYIVSDISNENKHNPPYQSSGAISPYVENVAIYKKPFHGELSTKVIGTFFNMIGCKFKSENIVPLSKILLDEPSINVNYTIYESIFKFVEFTKHTAVHYPNYMPRGLYMDGTDPNSPASMGNIMAVDNVTGLLKNRVSELLEKKFGSLIYNMNNKKYRNSYNNRDVNSFDVSGEYEHKFNKITVNTIVKHEFIFSAELLDDAAVTYIDSKLCDIAFSCNIDTANKSDLVSEISPLKNDTYMNDLAYESLYKTLSFIDTLINDRLNRLSSNCTEEDENTMFKTEVGKMTFIMGCLGDMLKHE